MPQAAAYYRRALELTPVGHPQRPTLLRKGTELAWRAGKVDVDEAIRAYEEAMDQALENGDDHEAAWCMRRLYFQIGFRGDTVAARQLLDRGIELLEHMDGEPPELLAELYACRAEDEMFAGRTKGSLEWADRALALPHSASVDLMALHIRGNGRCELGDLDGMNDLWDAVHRAEASANGVDIAQSYSYLSEWVGLQEGPLRSLEMNRAQIEACEVRGMAGQAMWSTAESLWMLYDAGRWDEALERAARAIEWATQQEDSQVGTVGLTYSARILAHRGAARRGGIARRAVPALGPADRRPPDPVAGARHRRGRRLGARRRAGRDRTPPRVRRRDAGRTDGVPRAPAAGGGPHLPAPR